MLNFIRKNRVVITNIMFLFLVLLFIALTITTKNILDFGYTIFLALAFTKYLFIKREE